VGGRETRQRRRLVKASGKGADREFEMIDDVVADVTTDELREFLEADTLGVQADPVFKEQLRRRLWDLVCSQVGGDAPPQDEEI